MEEMTISRLASKPDASLLCLKCRSINHGISNCPAPSFLAELDGSDWVQSSLRDRVRVQLAALPTPTSICQRCRSLDLPKWLITTPTEGSVEDLKDTCRAWKYRAKYPRKFEIFRELGEIGTLRLQRDCGLCRCLFDILPNPRSPFQVATLALSWTLFRLEHHIAVDSAEKRTTSRYVTAFLDPPAPGTELHRTITVEGDGLAIASNDDLQIGLGSAKVEPDSINFNVVRSWLKICLEKHQYHCLPDPSPSLLAIRLIDAKARLIVPWSDETREYLALSYVWGQTTQNFPCAGKIGRTIPALPQTLEDAMTFTLQIGMRYVWIDSVCIDQSDDDDKQKQIGVMQAIYQNAKATIVAIDGEDANAGLPRVSRSVPLPQVSCLLPGTRLTSIGPTLECLLSEARWSTRAWTYQEAILSTRCIYLSKYGIYFECNSMACSEFLDTASSPIHNATVDLSYVEKQTYIHRLNLGRLRNPITKPIYDRAKALNVYAILSSSYGRRQLTVDGDALSAFSGILQSLQKNAYASGFRWGLPLRELNWAMAWQAYDPHSAARPDFPTWSWLSNIGGFWPGAPSTGREGVGPDKCPFDMELAIVQDPFGMKHRSVFEQTYDHVPPETCGILAGDPLSRRFLVESRGNIYLPDGLDAMQSTKLLLFDSFAFEFPIAKRWEEEGNECHSLITVVAAGVELSGITTYDPDSQWTSAGPQLWLLLTRHIEGRKTLHNMILLRRKGWHYERADMLRLAVPNDKIWLLRELGLHRLRGVLA